MSLRHLTLALMALSFPLAGGAAAQSSADAAKTINEASAVAGKGYSPALVKAQILLDRAGFSPGVIDGYDGQNFRNALAAFAKARKVSAKLDETSWAALAPAGAAPAVQTYTITAADVAGPFTPNIPTKFSDMAKLDRLGYKNAKEALAERFHMSEGLLTQLNPGVDFSKAGGQIAVAAPGAGVLGAPVAMIRINAKTESLIAYDKADNVVGYFPATVGSTQFPTPAGSWSVNAVAVDPVYFYDPKRLTFGEGEAAGALKLAAGPNNPVGAVWIDLTKDTYGIHGAPEPRLVGKVSSHGCVRLTNWDALALAKAVSKETKVVFDNAAT
jgi:lipoprotein-anchoring transpeptidase ErfK/SrfK